MDRKKAIALSFSVPVAWGFSYPLMKIGMDSMNATSIVALRCIIAFVVCLLLFHKRAFRINRDLMVRAAIIGAIMATELTCMCLGSSLTSASTAGFLQSLTVVIVPFANAALLRRACALYARAKKAAEQNPGPCGAPGSCGAPSPCAAKDPDQ